MDTVINKLSEIETAASAILEGAANQKKQLDQQQEERIAEFDRQIEQETSAEIEKLRRELSASAEQEAAHLRETSDQALQDLEAYYSENHETLATRLYEKIIRK